ncbi:ClpV1 family T6SS ATPase [Pandoraea iniqua]|uniref:ClpV1 family T6SS ATPase n=1 Tax=Pandoraea iniqua TaxID=2508288 RepID=A0A5E4YED1_9BURK|nr:type VI secretion system ATPase TssH [Pandoraea iniqua]VVE46685.1 ClpV1 family T6SS ATPase [Pandoraea iniqua]
MVAVDLKQLFSRLNGYCRGALEDAAGLALSRGHYEIHVEHWLRKLLDAPDADAMQMLRAAGIDGARVTNALDAGLAGLASGNSGRPALSPRVQAWAQDAWMTSSITLGQTQIRGAGLLMALILRRDEYILDACYAPLLQGLSTPALLGAFESIAESSCEAEALPVSQGVGPHGAQAMLAGAQTSALAQFCDDFTARAAAGKIDPVFGRDAELCQVIDILARRRKNNPICVGEPGVGKTALAEALALRIVAGDVPDILIRTRVVGLDIGRLEAGASVRGEFERRLRAVIDEVRASSVPVVLFIDEAHMLIGAGGSGSSDAANLLKPALARGELRALAATTWSEYKKYFEKDAALARRFQLVKLDAPSVMTTIDILRGLKSVYEQAHGVMIRDEAIVAAAELSHRYITGRQLPDKAVDLLDTAAARVKISQRMEPAALVAVQRRIASLQREAQAMLREATYDGQASPGRLQQIDAELAQLQARHATERERWAAIQAAAQGVMALRARCDDEPAPTAETLAGLKAATLGLAELQTSSLMLHTEVDAATIANVVSDWTGVPLGHLQHDRASNILALAERVKARIVGQDAALEQIANALKATSSALADASQPLGVFLLAGPSGVGKTETAHAIAEQLFGDERALITLNMSEYQEQHSVSRLVGSPPGYVGYGQGGVLTEAVRQRPYAVLLLDEVEKAHLDVVNLFYQVFDKGTLCDGEGREVNFANTLILLTSNLASEEITRACEQAREAGGEPDAQAITTAIHPALVRHFPPALLARMMVVPFMSLAASVLRDIVTLKLTKISARVWHGARLKLQFSSAVVDRIAQRCCTSDNGARSIDDIVKRHVLPPVADALLIAQCDTRDDGTITVDVNEQGAWEVRTQWVTPTSATMPMVGDGGCGGA